MKRKSFVYGLLISLWVSIFLCIDLSSFCQEEIAQAFISNEELMLELPKANLKHIAADTVLPTICNSGKGLIHIDRISFPGAKKGYRFNNQVERNLTLIFNEGYTESELKDLHEQMHLMDERYHYELEKQRIQENLWIDLEGIIRGINTAPIY